MSMPLWFYNLSVYCVQLAILIAAGALMVAVTRLCEPRLQRVDLLSVSVAPECPR